MTRHKALVVDDEPIVRMMAAETIGDAGMEVIECETADEALEHLWDPERAQEICFVLTDIRMPGTMNGADLARMIAWRWPWIHIIITSGFHDGAGMLPEKARYVPKPWPRDVILQTAVQARNDA